MDPLQMAYLGEIGLRRRQEEIAKAAEYRLAKQMQSGQERGYGLPRIPLRRVLSWSAHVHGVGTRTAH